MSIWWIFSHLKCKDLLYVIFQRLHTYLNQIWNMYWLTWIFFGWVWAYPGHRPLFYLPPSIFCHFSFSFVSLFLFDDFLSSFKSAVNGIHTILIICGNNNMSYKRLSALSSWFRIDAEDISFLNHFFVSTCWLTFGYFVFVYFFGFSFLCLFVFLDALASLLSCQWVTYRFSNFQ